MRVQVSLDKYKQAILNKSFVCFKGQVTKVVGLTIESTGPETRVGELCRIVNPRTNREVLAEVVGFRDKNVLLMPLGEMTGIGPGNHVIATGTEFSVRVGQGLLGRVLDGLGNPIDGKGNIQTDGFYPVENVPPHPLKRPRINEVLPLGVKCIDSMLTLGKGQRLGIFAGSGVGKSTLIGMIARNTKADIIVIGLIGERGREVRDFLERDLTDEGLKRSVVVVATSDQPALIRKKGAMVATTIAEYFRDCGKDVLLLMDSLTRFSMAQREIGLSIGEPPVSRGYTPSVFSVMPKLLERSGTSDKGSITGLYTVLVDGDDMTEPVTDTARSILDGHVVLSRQMAHKNHYPAIDVLESISRVMSDIVTDEHKKVAAEIRKNLAVYREAEDLINVGAYVKGSNAEIDRAISVIGAINEFLTQGVNEKFDFEQTLELMKKALEGNG
ncbi:MAG: flagellar protein export ATPase FliI [Clostridiaceae bacterium]|nr:flagellar protein export ATPase FliI [Clostridiaceae bacterium]